MRRISVHPDGAVIVSVSGRTAIDAIMTSFVVVPDGLVTVSDPDVAAFDDDDRTRSETALIGTATIAHAVEAGTPVHDMAVLADPVSVLAAPRTFDALPVFVDWLHCCA